MPDRRVWPEGHAMPIETHRTALAEPLELRPCFETAENENARLEARLGDAIRDLRASRARIVAAADRERRRVERDLHDGAQLRLIALRVKLELLDARDPSRRADLVRELRDDADAAIDSLRSLVHGIYPSLLVDRGLRDALAWAARSAAVESTVDAQGIGRYAPDVEAAVYFCCLEALQNAARHAGPAARVSVRLREVGSALVFEVRDDGRGFDPQCIATAGGVTSMRDRAGAAGGTLDVIAAPGAGTIVRGIVPIGAS
jgi:signal transduction histidine kinase